MVCTKKGKTCRPKTLKSVAVTEGGMAEWHTQRT